MAAFIWFVHITKPEPMPLYVRLFFFVMSSLGFMCGLILSFAHVRVAPEGVSNRHFTKWFVRWKDVQARSQLGPEGSVYVRTRDGNVLGFSSWCMYRERCDRLAAALERRLGPGAVGEDLVAPWPVKALIG